MSARHHRFGRPPAKSTLTRRLLLLAMRPEGVTEKESREAGAPANRLASLFGTYLPNEKGYDLRHFRCEKHRACTGYRNNTNAWAWRLVGKYRWNGTYRSFLNNYAHDASADRRAA